MTKQTKANSNGPRRKSRGITKADQAAFTDEQIRRRAYEIYLARGRASGDELGDWLQAKKELGAETGRRKVTSTAS